MYKKPHQKKGLLDWLREAFIFLLIVMAVGLGADLWRSQSMASGKVPSVALISVLDESIDLQQMSQEKPVLVYFWATWCAVCRTVSPSIDFMSDRYQVVTVALNSGKKSRIKEYLKAKEYDFSVINDPKGMISSAWGVSVTPTIFIIDKGNVSSVTTGFTSPMGMWLRLFFA